MPISLIAVVVLGLLVAGCGGGSSGSSGSGEPDKAEFISQANEVCDEANEVLLKKVEKNQDVAGATIAAFEVEIEKIGALTPPKGDEKQIESMLGHLENSIESIETEEDINTANTELAEAEKIADAYGLSKKGCLVAR